MNNFQNKIELVKQNPSPEQIKFNGGTFHLTNLHIKLLTSSHVRTRLSEIEYGAAEIDGKRPYGNGDVIGDVANLIGLTESFSSEELTREELEFCQLLHTQTPTALQLILSNKSFDTGTFFKPQYFGQWRRV